VDFLLLLAQEAPSVDKAIDWADRASQLGVAGICLFIMFLALGLTYGVARKNAQQAGEVARLNAVIASKEENFRRELSDAQNRIADLEKGFRTDTERLLREMIERGEDTSEVLNSNTNALRDMTLGLQQLTNRIEYIERKLNHSGGGVA
jgi:methyl-accepting chemotaxis protein